MGKKAGALLWNRKRIALDPGVPSSLWVNTGLMQPNTGFADYSPDEPVLGPAMTPTHAVPPAPPFDPAPFGVGEESRIQVVPLAPLPDWDLILAHSEPFVDAETGEVWVYFETQAPVELNVLFWDPHSIVGPGDADFYNPPRD